MTNKLTKSQKKMFVQMKILDYFTMANDPTRRSIHGINKIIRKYKLTSWFKRELKDYYISDDKMANYLYE